MNETNLRDVMSELGIKVNGRNSDGWLVCSCPFAPLGFHEKATDNNPSFFAKINAEGHSGYHCFTCGNKGSIHALVVRLEHLTGESYGSLAMRVKLKELEGGFREFGEWEDTAKEAAVIPPEVWRGLYPLAWDCEPAREYLASRGVGKTTSGLLGLLWDEKDQRVLFPVRDTKGGVYGFTGRSVLDEKGFPNPKYKKIKDYLGLPKANLVLGMDLIQEGKPLLLVEGLFAYAHLVEIGAREHCNPVASMGAHLSDEQAELLTECGEVVYVMYDEDLAGDIGMFGKLVNGKHQGGGAIDKLKRHVPTMTCYYPDGLDDVDDMTIERLRWVLKNAEFATV